jgi:hypothetical protein
MPLLFVALAVVFVWMGVRRGRAKARAAPPPVRNPAGARVCGRCGSPNLTARRAKGAKLGLGLLSLGTPKTRLVCDQCGNEMLP